MEQWGGEWASRRPGASRAFGFRRPHLRGVHFAAKGNRMFLSAWVSATLSFFDGSPKTPPHPQPDRNPVLLIHGISDSEWSMQWMAHYLRREGWEVHTLSLKPNWAQKGIEPLAGQIDAYAREQFGSRRFDLVGFSMGGLVSRYYVQRLGGIERVDHLVTLSLRTMARSSPISSRTAAAGKCVRAARSCAISRRMRTSSRA